MATSLISKVIIEQALALLRIDNFLDKKDIIDDKLQIDHPLADHTKYDPKQSTIKMGIVINVIVRFFSLIIGVGNIEDSEDNPGHTKCNINADGL